LTSDSNNNGACSGSHRKLVFALGRFRGSRPTVIVSLLGMHMAVRERMQPRTG
jgi:hypothetical protein